MNHRPFEEWLLSDEHLTTQQKSDLQAHLRTCTTCVTLAEVNLAFGSVRAVSPAPGFVDRFQIRLAAQRKVQRKRNFWGFFILVIAVLGALTWLTWPILKVAIQSPVDLLASWLSSLVSLWTSLQAIGETGSTLLKVLPGFIPAYVGVLILLATASWSLIWVFSLMKFAKIPQGV